MSDSFNYEKVSAWCKKNYRSYGCLDSDLEDLTQHVALETWRRPKARWSHLAIDFARKNYGDSRFANGIKKQGETRCAAEFDCRYHGSHQSNEAPDRTVVQKSIVESIWCSLTLGEKLVLLEKDDPTVSPTRQSQNRSTLQEKVKDLSDLREGRSLLETEVFVIDWIRF